LFFERVDEILPAQRSHDVLGIVEQFEQNVVASANAVKDDSFLIPPPSRCGSPGRLEV
jgi:hypothetical protein